MGIDREALEGDVRTVMFLCNANDLEETCFDTRYPDVLMTDDDTIKIEQSTSGNGPNVK